jgi:hypothetical protein
MTDFESALALRVQRLDAAIPAPLLPARTGGGTLAAAVLSRKRRWRVPLTLAAAALLVAASVVTAGKVLYPDVANPGVELALEEAVPGGTSCVPIDRATAAIRERLDAHGFSDWTIRSTAGVGTAPCINTGYLASEHVVLLFAALGQAGVDAVHAAADELLANCYGRSDAIALISSVVRSIGVTNFRVAADPWGPQGGPIDQYEAYKAHVAAGCFVYVSLGYEEGGQSVYYLWGPFP